MVAALPAMHDAYRDAILALLRVQAQPQIDRTDAAPREVEVAIARLKADLSS
jgi:hypothetical protein